MTGSVTGIQRSTPARSPGTGGPGTPATRPGRRDAGWRAKVPTVMSGVLGTLAVICAAAAVSQVFFHRMQHIRVVIDQLLLPAPANVAYAAFVGVLAVGVARRKRVAYWILVGYFVLQLAFDALGTVLLGFTLVAEHANHVPAVVPWFLGVNLVLTVAVLVVLRLCRDQFYARVQRASLRKALVTLVFSLFGFALLGEVLVEAFPGSLEPGAERVSYALDKVLGGAFGFAINRHGEAPGWVNFVLGLFGAIALFAALGVLFRSQRAIAHQDATDEQRVRALLATYGEDDSLGYFATRRDKAVLFSASGKAAITYRVVAGVCLASGDPIGDPEAWGPAIGAWLGQAREYAWTPAVMGASEAGATAYARAGLRVIELGDEAVIDVRTFGLEGRDMRPVRQAVNRVARAGYTARVRRHCEIPPEEMARVLRLADQWRDTETERGFSMALGRLGDPADGRCVLVEARDPHGQEAALLSFTPWGRHGLSLDLMRRDRTSDNGMVEFLIAALVAAAPRLGVERISLNFAMFRSAFEEGARIGAGPVLRAWRRLLLFLSRWFQLESLYRSNVKYRPAWVPRYLCYEDIHDLAKVGVASLLAEGFFEPPSLPTLLRRGRSAALPWPLPAAAPAAEPVPAAVEPAPEVAATPAEQLPEQVRVRMAKLAALRQAGVEPYPVGFARTHDCAQVRAAHPDLAADARTGEHVAVAGRVMLLRDHGGVCFATVRDWTGDLQVMLTGQDTGAPALADWRSTVDLGDHVGVSGEVVTSRRGELSVLAKEWTLTAKCLRPLPDKHAGLADPESRVRQRYLDLVVNPDARTMLRARAAALHAVRGALVSRGFLEVETPILQRVHGGANARPFRTHINAYNQDMYLRIAPELFLKRLAVGGVERVFEIGRNFRNEGADATHNPEFTMLEAYQAYGDYVSMRELARDLVLAAATAAHGVPLARRPEGEVDLSGPWPVVPVYQAVGAALGTEVDPGTPAERLRELADAAQVPYDPAWDAPHLVLELYERLVEARTVEPTFYTDFPVAVSPLTRAHRADPRLAERWDLVAFGMELGTAYSELVDPVEQRRRLTAQSLLAAGGDPEAMELDEDFLLALEYAMPPSGGLGMGMDRLAMMLTGLPIRQTLPFPLVRPAGEADHRPTAIQ